MKGEEGGEGGEVWWVLGETLVRQAAPVVTALQLPNLLGAL